MGSRLPYDREEKMKKYEEEFLRANLSIGDDPIFEVVLWLALPKYQYYGFLRRKGEIDNSASWPTCV